MTRSGRKVGRVAGTGQRRTERTKTGVTDKPGGFIGRPPILSSWADFTSRPGGFDQYMLLASTYGGKAYHDGVDAVESTSIANKRDADGVATC